MRIKGEWQHFSRISKFVMMARKPCRRENIFTSSVTAPPYYFRGHGACREGHLPSGLRKKWSGAPNRGQKRVEIDYEKLREICLEANTDNDGEELNRDERHERFMSNYHLLLHEKTSDCKEKQSSLQSTVPILPRLTPLEFAVRSGAEVSRGHNKWKALKRVDTYSRLKSMLELLRKLPLQRTANEVRELSRHLSHFPSFFPPTCCPQRIFHDVKMGVAGRCLLETIPKKGFSLPGMGGTYLILEGRVEEKTKTESTQEITTTQLHEGDCFGAMEENFVTKLRYPMYVTASRCALIRITVSDYKRVLQKCEEAERRERVVLIQSCPALNGVSSAITEALARDICWETIPCNTVLLNEGEIIRKVGFIREGACEASIAVPQSIPPSKLVIGRLGPGSCVGEVLLRGHNRQPYQITTTSDIRIGWIPSTTVTMNEVSKLIPTQKNLTITVPSRNIIRQKYAHELMVKEWSKIKGDILSEARDKR